MNLAMQIHIAQERQRAEASARHNPPHTLKPYSGLGYVAQKIKTAAKGITRRVVGP